MRPSRQIIALEEDNATLARNLNGKEEALRNAQVDSERTGVPIISDGVV